MPNFDAGHYFLTLLVPLRTDALQRDGQSHSRRHLVKEALANMPGGERTVATQGDGRDNPFARTTRTHFARLFLLDDTVFNGRLSGDSLLARLSGADPLTPQPVDRLSTQFLVVAVDFDAASGDERELRKYTDEVWTSMHAELLYVFQHCVGFDRVEGPEAFFHYLKKCQVETTMPFNDYWSAPPALGDVDLKPYLIGAAVALIVFVAGLFMLRGWLIAIAFLALALVVFLGVRKIMDTARVPFPRAPAPAPPGDLPTVLKSLYVQRAFTAFAIETQGDDDVALHEKFGVFMTETQPNNPAAPTQRPGVIGV